MASKQAHHIQSHILAKLGDTVADQFGNVKRTVDLFPLKRLDKQLDECIGPHINRDDAADIIIKLFDVQWNNLKTE